MASRMLGAKRPAHFIGRVKIKAGMRSDTLSLMGMVESSYVDKTSLNVPTTEYSSMLGAKRAPGFLERLKCGTPCSSTSILKSPSLRA